MSTRSIPVVLIETSQGALELRRVEKSYVVAWSLASDVPTGYFETVEEAAEVLNANRLERESALDASAEPMSVEEIIEDAMMLDSRWNEIPAHLPLLKRLLIAAARAETTGQAQLLAGLALDALQSTR